MHCSATKPSQNVGVREIRQWHKEQGWLDVGYHFIIKRATSVLARHDQLAIDSLAKCNNHTSTAVNNLSRILNTET
ncbi:hypothetical protein, partial [Xylella fastidiosa]|uniref:hypothetical protein n=1 Tax=Xylella fastidiosa TaxID=2371 RepID=UPI0031B8952F